MDKHSGIHDIAEQAVIEVAVIPKYLFSTNIWPWRKNAVTTLFCKVESESARWKCHLSLES